MNNGVNNKYRSPSPYMGHNIGVRNMNASAKIQTQTASTMNPYSLNKTMGSNKRQWK
jgi:hypothetical protein